MCYQLAMKDKTKFSAIFTFSVRRTKVIDDESDYFATDSKWLSKKERKVLKDKTKFSAIFTFSVRRTKVIDDESDYFATDSKWLSKKERKVLKDKEDRLQKLKHASRRDKKITLDFAGRKVIEEKPTEEINGKQDELKKAKEKRPICLQAEKIIQTNKM